MKISELSAEITNALKDYGEEAITATKEATKEVTSEVNDIIKSHVTFNNRSGDYIKAFSTKKSYEGRTNVRYTWHVKSPHYRLTHLLEYGHALKNGGRTKAYPHIRFGYEYARDNLIKRIKEKL